MARPCTVCTHPHIEKINTSLIRGASTIELAKEWGVSEDALQRHRTTHLPEALVKSQEAKEAIHGTELIAELQKCIERVNLLSDACDDWLRDPDDPNRYFVGARSEDIKVVYEEEKEGKTIRKKAPLSELLARIEGRYTITAVETKHADPRELLLKSYDRLESRLELVAKLLGMINDAPTVNITINPQWLELRAVIVQSLKDYPEARLSVAAALVELEGGTIAR